MEASLKRKYSQIKEADDIKFIYSLKPDKKCRRVMVSSYLKERKQKPHYIMPCLERINHNIDLYIGPTRIIRPPKGYKCPKCFAINRHLAIQCPYYTCSACSKKGHLLKECPMMK
ncbi:hypothetical protein Glove_209g124 [Diversispora epigaea]|uniref:CCHC-type domain-containing protein n=1 Tax=Diversispora epigaea TaxID=1348612 RepID=A0A397ILF6_9GLOM|nr:hypothetical protein Glove_209g124 [Diversispora epigaea]